MPYIDASPVETGPGKPPLEKSSSFSGQSNCEQETLTSASAALVEIKPVKDQVPLAAERLPDSALNQSCAIPAEGFQKGSAIPTGDYEAEKANRGAEVDGRPERMQPELSGGGGQQLEPGPVAESPTQAQGVDVSDQLKHQLNLSHHVPGNISFESETAAVNSLGEASCKQENDIASGIPTKSASDAGRTDEPAGGTEEPLLKGQLCPLSVLGGV